MLFRQDIEPNCSYCLYGTGIGRGEVVCRNYGIMSAGGCCDAFVYEPTKREPEYARGLNTANVSEKDFEI